ncbi:NAD(P)/FAD-dependent oxidoreductase [Tropicimonas sp. IMCC6043]|uniref:NAD(P)/FAD-dependent oxidoreductase n=1 Tax=Tropicimonas sp. IMCC6043 TaxID=2510645 RepID=UPI00101D1339|nr:NAD(P)/FAD-dependent oxidoreductase [Tropicimonas sp. IMCC6043]RYH08581.1 NAD(P)/FAD-dependent oxidoreductase [Tropicimonas sp. IMCC6043]
MADFDAVVIGAGAVGLACAARLADGGRSVLVLEAAAHPGEGISSRNSEVIHAGLYYPTGSLKHELCVAGRRLLYEYLGSRGIAFRKCGKIVVATGADEVSKIEELKARGEANGVEGLRLLSAAEVTFLEPAVASHGGLLSPETGIFDSHQFFLALIAGIEGQGGHVALRTPFERAEPTAEGFAIRTGGSDPTEISATCLVNSAGLAAPRVARCIAGVPPDAIPAYRLAKGNYYRLIGRAPFSRLIYPAPVDGGLGVHATIDIAGNLRFGPDVEWLPEGLLETHVDYHVHPERGTGFYDAVRRYWPGLPDNALAPDYSGCRPKLSGPGAPAADFDIRVEALPGLVNLYGIESPGLTAALAIAELVARDLGHSPSSIIHLRSVSRDTSHP